MIKVSIFIPTFNRADRLKIAIQSALNQDYKNLEVVVSDNNSTDNTFEIIQEFSNDERLKYYKNSTNIGVLRNVRKGILELITGDYFLFLSDDDYLINNSFISQAVEIIENNENILMVSSNFYINNEITNSKTEVLLPSNNLVEEGKVLFMEYLKDKYAVGVLCVNLVNRDFVIKMNDFSNMHNHGIDIEIALKCCLCGNVGIIDKFSAVYARHLDSDTYYLYENFDSIIEGVTRFLNPFFLADKYDKLTTDEKSEWKNLILGVYVNCLTNVLYYFPERYEEAIKRLSSKDKKFLDNALNNKRFRLLKFLNKIHLFKPLYNFIFFLYKNKISHSMINKIVRV